MRKHWLTSIDSIRCIEQMYASSMDVYYTDVASEIGLARNRCWNSRKSDERTVIRDAVKYVAGSIIASNYRLSLSKTGSYSTC